MWSSYHHIQRCNSRDVAERIWCIFEATLSEECEVQLGRAGSVVYLTTATFHLRDV